MRMSHASFRRKALHAAPSELFILHMTTIRQLHTGVIAMRRPNIAPLRPRSGNERGDYQTTLGDTKIPFRAFLCLVVDIRSHKLTAAPAIASMIAAQN